MPRGRELLQIPVTAAGSDEVLGEVVDLVFDPEGRLSALIVIPAKGLFRKERRVEIARFLQVGEAGAVLVDRDHLDQEESQGEGCRLRGGPTALCGRTIVGEDGREIGTVGDVALEGDSFEIWGFEVSDGALMDLLDGRSIVDAKGALLHDDSVVLTNLSHMNLRVEEHPSS